MSDLLDKVGSATSGVWKVIKTIISVLLLLVVVTFGWSLYKTSQIMDGASSDKKAKAEQTAAQAQPSGDQVQAAPQAPQAAAPVGASLRLLSIERVDDSRGRLSHAMLKIEAANQTGKVITGMKLKFSIYDQFGDLVQSFEYKLEDRIEPTNGKIITTGIGLNQFMEKDQRLANLKSFKSSIEILAMITE